MGKQKHHGHRLYQPPVNRYEGGQVRQAYSWLFPRDAQQIVQRVREWDCAYLEAHPLTRAFCRRYVPGEGYPQHDPAVGFVAVFRMGDQRVRAFYATRPRDLPYVSVPVEQLQTIEDGEEEAS